MVSTGPSKRFSGYLFEALDIDIFRGKQIDMLLRKILADDPDKVHPGVIAGRQGEKSGRSAQPFFVLTRGRFHCIQRYRTHNCDAH